MHIYESEPLQLPRFRKDELNQMKGNTEGVGGSKKFRKYFLKYLLSRRHSHVKITESI